MRFVVFLVQAFSLSVAICAHAEYNKGEPVTTPALIAKTVAWQTHWDDKAGILTKIPATVSFKMHEQSDVLVNGLDWLVTFVYEGNQPFPHSVKRLALLPAEVRQRAIQPFSGLATATVRIPSYTNSFHRITTITAAKRENLLNAFNHEASSTNMLSFYKDQNGRSLKKIRFWIAPVDPDFPVILYIVEGSPYIGRVDFDTQSLKAIYSDFDYIGDEGTEQYKRGLKLMKAIKAEGDPFDFRNGNLIPSLRRVSPK